MESAGVNEVIDHADLFFDGEGPVGLVAEVLRYGGDGVAMVDGEGDDGGECFVAAYEGDIGAVEGGNDGNTLPLWASTIFLAR